MAKLCHIPERMKRVDPKVYGCLFCVTGKEEAVVQQLKEASASVRAVVARREKYLTTQGVKSKTAEVFLPSYVFFEAPKEMTALEWIPRKNVHRILNYGDGAWQLCGSDLEFAKWLFHYDGYLAFSKAYQVGNKVHIFSGPLKELEGQIQKVDRRGKSARVVLQFFNMAVSAWLGYELIEPVQDAETAPNEGKPE